MFYYQHARIPGIYSPPERPFFTGIQENAVSMAMVSLMKTIYGIYT